VNKGAARRPRKKGAAARVQDHRPPRPTEAMYKQVSAMQGTFGRSWRMRQSLEN